MGCGSTEPASHPGVEIVLAAPEGEVASLVVAELENARRDGRKLLVYVSADWCEPCRYFEQAVDSGRLTKRFAGLRLVKFDSDRDDSRLAASGYAYKSIPMFTVPDARGRGGGRMQQGAIKGPGAVDFIASRLEALFAP